jgi:hypothetical protein
MMLVALFAGVVLFAVATTVVAVRIGLGRQP